MLTSPDWTRAVFVRDPKERILSAYLDKAARKDAAYVRHHCCNSGNTTGDCAKKASKSFKDFIEVVIEMCCCDPHWKPQSQRMGAPLWKYVNFVGRFDYLALDTKRLLETLGAWTEYGESGWGKHHNESIFGESTGARHKTDAYGKLRRYYNSTEMEALVEEFYRSDYEHPMLNLTNKRINADLYQPT
jgi:hypothetical protein